MELQFAWRDEFSIGVPEIDRDHQQLFNIINKLYTMREEGKSNSGCARRASSFSGHMR